MLFNSPQFFFFFAIVYVLYRWSSLGTQNWILLIAGYVFYGWWDIRFLFLIAFSTTVDFWIGSMLGEGRVAVRQRIIASAFIIASAVVFLCFDWHAMQSNGWHLTLSRLGLQIAVGTIVVVFSANFLHAPVAAMDEERRRQLLLIVTVSVNLGFLAIFKYFNFFVSTATVALQSLGLDPLQVHLEVILPVGISFYTFQSLSYTIDISRGRIKPVRRFSDFALFVAFFPPMVAGPIERARQLLPQLLTKRQPSLNQTANGLILILMGLFKKVAIADGLAIPVDAVFNSTGIVSGSDVIVATVFFALQIYCDFSGYTDIARGVAKLLGFELVINFNLPYFSRNPSEFWRRWHISLSTWLRDYLYVPLGGNRKGVRRTYVNLMTTMAMGGLWHGAAWNYIFWGVYQGALLCIHRYYLGADERPVRSPHHPPECINSRWSATRVGLGNTVRILTFFVFVCYGWLLFRAHSFEQIATFSAALIGMGSDVPSVIHRPALASVSGLLLLAILEVSAYWNGSADSYRTWSPAIQALVFATMLFILIMGMSNAPAQFIYFQF